MNSSTKNLVRAATFGALLAATPAFTNAQTQLVRGSIDGIGGTNLFQLDCTGIRVVSNTVNLQALHDASHQNDIEFDLQVTQIGSNPTVLDVVSATQTLETFSMGNLRFDQTGTWEVFAAPGSVTSVFLNLRSNTSYLPLGAFGTWVLGGNFALINTGVVAPNGQFRFPLLMPTIPALVGTEFTCQAIVVEPSGTPFVTNPDCKEVRAN